MIFLALGWEDRFHGWRAVSEALKAERPFKSCGGL